MDRAPPYERVGEEGQSAERKLERARERERGSQACRVQPRSPMQQGVCVCERERAECVRVCERERACMCA